MSAPSQAPSPVTSRDPPPVTSQAPPPSPATSQVPSPVTSQVPPPVTSQDPPVTSQIPSPVTSPIISESPSKETIISSPTPSPSKITVISTPSPSKVTIISTPSPTPTKVTTIVSVPSPASTPTSIISSPSSVTSKTTSSKPPVTPKSSSKPKPTSQPTPSEPTIPPTSITTSFTPEVSTSTTVFSTTLVFTDVNGNLGTQTVLTTELIFQTQSSDNPGASSSNLNVAAIAGGAVGGAIAILILMLIIFFCLRQQSRRTGDPDDNFDPDRLDPARLGGTATRPGAMPDIDLVGAEVTPFAYQSQPLPPQIYDPYGQMVQQPGMPVVSGEGSGYNRSSDPYSWTSGPYSPTSEQGITGLNSADFRGPSPGPSLATSGTLPSSKERESVSERARLQVANSGSGDGGSSRRTSAVVQHVDSGRLQQQTVHEEIPPSYYSISPHDRRGVGRAKLERQRQSGKQ